MSVSLINRAELNKAMNTLSKNEAIQNFVAQQDFFKEYNAIEFGADSSEQFIGRSLWYGYIANITAFNVQYAQNEQIDFSDFDDQIEFEDVQDAIKLIGYLLYNTYTNNGTCFLQDGFINILNAIKEEFEVIEEPETPSYLY